MSDAAEQLTSAAFTGAATEASTPPRRSAGDANAGVARGTLANAALPGAAFHPDEFDVEVSQTSLAEADELLKATLDEAMRAVGGTRAFLALIDTLSGELVLSFTAGEGWTEDIRRLRVSVHANAAEIASRRNEAEPGTANRSLPITPPTSTRQGITRHVVVNGRRYWTGDVSRDPYYLGFFEDVKSEIAIPITARGGGTIGVMSIDSTQPDAFNESHANLLSALARRVAVIVAMAEHQLREEALISIGRDLSSTADIETLMQDVVEQATKILRADDCSLFLMDEDSETLRLSASHGPLHEQVGRQEVRYALGEGLTGWVAQHGKVIRVGDPRTDPRWKGVFEEAPADEVAAVMAGPVRGTRPGGKHGVLGVLRVVRHRKGSLYFLPQEFSQADEDVLVTLASQLAVAIDRTRLLELLLNSERMAAWGEMSARSAHMIGNAVFGVKGHLNELNHWLEGFEKNLRMQPNDTSGASAGGLKADSLAEPLQDARLLTESITRGIYRLEEILSEFRDFVLATQLHATPHDINQILRNVTAESFPKHSDIDLVLNLAPKLPPVLADEAKLKRAFSELIENAIDFQPHGGVLTIRTAMAEVDTMRELTRGQMLGQVVQIEFIDHGPGLSEQDRERVFTPFYTRKAKGMGLGLSIVKGIIEAHHGIIREIGGSAASTERGMRKADQGATSAASRPDAARLPRSVRPSTSGAHFIILIPAHIEAQAVVGESHI